MFRNQFFPATFFFLSTLLVLITIAINHRAALSQSDVTWRTDFEQAKAEARQMGKPLLVVFR